ncbi:uncharacterized protein PAC_16960 [Phialocephala subalpina]|uniref:LysM domain-containing protein n=1 Tax=Phialocephala subalpina TaxID=576137 RepID=A0A1L7XPT6_9HELO|nr:uncharacterized protein PAC_16960 [Phialocephala subalpina]
MKTPFLTAIIGILLSGSSAQFNLYPPVDPNLLARAYNVTPACISALNETLPDCDPTLFQMTINFDNYWWEDDNLTDLCLGNCTYEAQQWDSDVTQACADQWITAYGRLIPADSISGRYVDSMSTACLGSTEDERWCLSSSQNWTGSDVIYPDCTKTPTDPSCSGNASMIDPENERMANLYSNDVLCDNCFVRLLYARVTSPYLADSDHSDYLVDQLQDIGDICNTTIPNITIRALPSYVTAPPVTSINFGSTTTTISPPVTTTCSGQILNSSKKRFLQLQGRDIQGEEATSTCDRLSTTHGISTGTLQYVSNSDNCTITSSTCFPSACKLQQVPTGVTCDSLAASLNATTVQLLTWNKNILGLCDSLFAGQYICVTAPGLNSTYTLAAPPLGTDADAGNQQRGGPGGVVTPCPTYTNSPTAALGPTQTGIIAACNAYAMADNGIGCVDFAALNCIKTAQLFAWNGVLGPNGENCGSSFWAKEYYCIATAPSPTSTTAPAVVTTTTSTSTGVVAPGPTQTGIVGNCNKFAAAPDGMGCWDFATLNGITQAQLYTWNTVLGKDGANCGTAFWSKEYYCVGVSGSKVR